MHASALSLVSGVWCVSVGEEYSESRHERQALLQTVGHTDRERGWGGWLGAAVEDWEVMQRASSLPLPCCCCCRCGSGLPAASFPTWQTSSPAPSRSVRRILTCYAQYIYTHRTDTASFLQRPVNTYADRMMVGWMTGLTSCLCPPPGVGAVRPPADLLREAGGGGGSPPAPAHPRAPAR